MDRGKHLKTSVSITHAHVEICVFDNSNIKDRLKLRKNPFHIQSWVKSFAIFAYHRFQGYARSHGGKYGEWYSEIIRWALHPTVQCVFFQTHP